MCLSGPSLILYDDTWRIPHPAVHPPKRVGPYLGTKGSLGKVNCANSDVTVDGLLSTTDSKADVMGYSVWLYFAVQH